MQNLVITNAGQELMTSLITKGTAASFTKIATSEHVYEKEELGILLALEDIKQEVPISKLEQKDASTIEITAAITNEELTEGYYIKALGLYMKNDEGNEILYAVAIDDIPDYVPAFDNKTISSIIYRLNVRVSNSEQVTLEVNPGAYALQQDLIDTQKELEKVKENTASIANALLDTDAVTTAFESVFSYIRGGGESGQAMDEQDILNAINTEWNGESSENPNALSASNIMKAINTEWNGESSENPNALSAEEIYKAIENAEKE